MTSNEFPKCSLSQSDVWIAIEGFLFSDYTMGLEEFLNLLGGLRHAPIRCEIKIYTTSSSSPVSILNDLRHFTTQDFKEYLDAATLFSKFYRVHISIA